MCASLRLFCWVWLLKLCTDQTIYNIYPRHDTLEWTNHAIELHTRLGLRVEECATWQQSEREAYLFEVNRHIFNMSNIKPGFSFHYPQTPVYAKHLFLHDGHHFQYI